MSDVTVQRPALTAALRNELTRRVRELADYFEKKQRRAFLPL